MSSNALKQLIRSKALMGFCALLFLGLQLTSQIHQHDLEQHHFGDTCSVCSALSVSGDSTPKTEFNYSAPDTEAIALFVESATRAQSAIQQRPPARAPPIS